MIPDSTDFSQPGPGHLYLDDKQVKWLATYKKNCDVMKLDLNSTKETLKQCTDNGNPPEDWWAKPSYVIGGMVISFSLGAVLVMALKD